MVEVALHLELRIAAAKRLGLTKVRLEMLHTKAAEELLDILRRAIHARQVGSGNLSIPKPRTGS